MKTIYFSLLIILIPNISLAQSADLALPDECQSINKKDQFLKECLISVPQTKWNESFKGFASKNEFEKSGAIVQFLPAKGVANPYRKVVYIIGPYIGQYLGKMEEIMAKSKGFDYEEYIGSTYNPIGKNISEEIDFIDSLSPTLKNMQKYFLDNKISILYISFGHPANDESPVSQKVYAAKKVLENFFWQRVSAIPDEKLPPAALIGYSLGGVVAKIALKEIEDEFNTHDYTARSKITPKNKTSHDVGMYFSFDSPHKGFLTPSSMQGFMIFLRNAMAHAKNITARAPGFLGELFEFAGLGFIVDFYEDKVNLQDISEGSDKMQFALNAFLTGPLSQDLMINNFYYPNNRSPNIGYIYSKLSMPKQTSINIGLTSASIANKPLNLADRYFQIRTGKDGTKAKIEMNVDANIPKGDDNKIFYGKFMFKNPRYMLGTRAWYKLEISPSSNKLERSSCSWEEPMADVESTLQSQFKEIWSNFSINLEETKACFIPAISSLATDNMDNIKKANKYKNLLINLNLKHGYFVSNSHFDYVLASTDNKQHLNFAPEILDNISTLLQINYNNYETLEQIQVAAKSSSKDISFEDNSSLDFQKIRQTIIESDRFEGKKDEDDMVAECIDDNGDGWGWNGTASCKVSDNTNRYETLKGSICVDKDGDGWGWDGNKSCKVSTEAEKSINNTNSQCVDKDGDGWGWDGAKSCKVGTQKVETNIINNNIKCVDSDGDGWGWDGTKSCRVN